MRAYGSGTGALALVLPGSDQEDVMLRLAQRGDMTCVAAA